MLCFEKIADISIIEVHEHHHHKEIIYNRDNNTLSFGITKKDKENKRY
jgi:hypothetical protein